MKDVIEYATLTAGAGATVTAILLLEPVQIALGAFEKVAALLV